MQVPLVGGVGQSLLGCAPLPPGYVHGFVQMMLVPIAAQRLYVPVHAGSTPPSVPPLLWPVPPPVPLPELTGFVHVTP